MADNQGMPQIERWTFAYTGDQVSVEVCTVGLEEQSTERFRNVDKALVNHIRGLIQSCQENTRAGIDAKITTIPLCFVKAIETR